MRSHQIKDIAKMKAMVLLQVRFNAILAARKSYLVYVMSM